MIIAWVLCSSLSSSSRVTCIVLLLPKGFLATRMTFQISWALLETVSSPNEDQCSLFFCFIIFLSLAASFLHSACKCPARLATFLRSLISLSHHGFGLNFLAFRFSFALALSSPIGSWYLISHTSTGIPSPPELCSAIA